VALRSTDCKWVNGLAGFSASASCAKTRFLSPNFSGKLRASNVLSANKNNVPPDIDAIQMWQVLMAK
jgi:hypothetical protein